MLKKYIFITNFNFLKKFLHMWKIFSNFVRWIVWARMRYENVLQITDLL